MAETILQPERRGPLYYWSLEVNWSLGLTEGGNSRRRGACGSELVSVPGTPAPFPFSSPSLPFFLQWHLPEAGRGTGCTRVASHLYRNSQRKRENTISTTSLRDRERISQKPPASSLLDPSWVTSPSGLITGMVLNQLGPRPGAAGTHASWEKGNPQGSPG